MLLISSVQQSDSVMHTYIKVYFLTLGDKTVRKNFLLELRVNVIFSDIMGLSKAERLGAHVLID